jgi:S-formylglutathione hydrolase FrmB
VIELLHGTPGAPEDWTRAGGADLTADRYAATHGGLAPIIVMPDPNGSWSADTECVDGTQGRAETYLVTDVPAWVIANLGASTDRRAWALVGSSEGGYCALDLVLRHPDRWATFVDLSGLDQPTYPGGALRLFGGDRQQLAAHDPRLLLAGLPPGPPIAGWFTAGTADGAVTTSVKEMATMASRRGIDTRLELIPNAHHTWRVFRHGFTDALPWVAQRLGLSPTVDPLTPPPHPHHTSPARRHRHPSGAT